MCLIRTMCTPNGIFIPKLCSYVMISVFIFSLALSFYAYKSTRNYEKSKVNCLYFTLIIYAFYLFMNLVLFCVFYIQFEESKIQDTWIKMSPVSQEYFGSLKKLTVSDSIHLVYFLTVNPSLGCQQDKHFYLRDLHGSKLPSLHVHVLLSQ